MEHPADLINVAVEELVKERYELPAFSTLDRLVGHIRTVVNNRLFGRIVKAMTPAQRELIDRLITNSSPELELTLSELKSPPKSARLSQIQVGRSVSHNCKTTLDKWGWLLRLQHLSNSCNQGYHQCLQSLGVTQVLGYWQTCGG